MIRKQVFIREDQQARLKALAAREGLAEAELIRSGIDMVLEKQAAGEDESWREAWKNIAGLWKDREDFDTFDADRRRRRAARRKRVNALMAKHRA